jgi:hypothetical protein
MKSYNKLLFLFLIFAIYNPLLFSQSTKTISAGEITFNDTSLNKEFNKVYLLQPGAFVVVKNLCLSEEIAIGLKNYFDISNKMALAYQDRDSLTIKIISEYQKLNLAVNNVEFRLKTIKDNLHSADFQSSLELLNKSSVILQNSNKQLDNAVVKLNDINSDLSGFQFADLWSILVAGLAGFIAGAIIF